MSNGLAALTLRELTESLRSALEIVRAEYAAMPAGALQWRPAEGEWCANEVLGHFIEAEERGFAGRIRAILARPDPELPGWEPADVASARDDCRRVPQALLAEFSRVREQSIALVRGLQAADLKRGGHHGQIGYVTVGELLNEWVHHDRNHIRQLLANSQAYVWPHMGSTQKFSLP